MMKVLAVGETYTVPDEPGLFLRIGNAGGLTISVDGKALPPLGRMGERKSFILDPQRLLAGTAAHSLDGVEAN
jgi:cytoskeleton protein RodZ